MITFINTLAFKIFECVSLLALLAFLLDLYLSKHTYIYIRILYTIIHCHFQYTATVCVSQYLQE